MLAALAWRNLWRRPQRTILSLLSIALVSGLLVFMLSFQGGVYETMKQGTLRIFDGYAQYQPKDYAEDPGIDRAIDDPQQIIREAAVVEGVTTVAPRVNSFAILANGAHSYGAAVIGVDPEREAALSAIPSMVQEGRYLRPTDTNTAVLGSTLARNLGLTVGGTVTLLGSAHGGSLAADVLKVVGIYHSGMPDFDRAMLQMPLARAQETFSMEGRVSTIALGGRTLAGVNRALPDLRGATGNRKIALLDWGALEPALRDGIILKYAVSLLFYLTLVVVVAFIILNTLLMSVLERTREFGILLAVGMRPGLIGTMVWLELIVLAITGCAIGLALGAGITMWFEQHGIPFPESLASTLAQFGMPSRLYPALTWLTASLGPGAILATILVGGIVPYVRVRRMTAALAMRGI